MPSSFWCSLKSSSLLSVILRRSDRRRGCPSGPSGFSVSENRVDLDLVMLWFDAVRCGSRYLWDCCVMIQSWKLWANLSSPRSSWVSLFAWLDCTYSGWKKLKSSWAWILCLFQLERSIRGSGWLWKQCEYWWSWPPFADTNTKESHWQKVSVRLTDRI